MAVPRLPGSSALPEIEGRIARQLTDWGYAVTLRPFRTSAARLTAASVAGAGLGWVSLLFLPLAAAPVSGPTVAVAGIAALVLTALLTVGIAERRLRLPLEEVEARNLEARRGEPRLWLVAHSDSKGQRFSLRTRVLAAGCAGVGAVGLVGLLAIRSVRPVPALAAVPVALAGVVGGAILSRSGARDDSPGAVDNASGTIAVLEAARRLRSRRDVGVLVTGAEEYGMEGARAWVAAGPAPTPFVNVDGVDGRGTVRVMTHRRRSQAASTMARALVHAFHEADVTARIASLPPGILVDGVVFARAGHPGVTVSQGGWRTLAVVHTRRDAPERLDLDGAVRVGEALAAAVNRMLG